MSELNKRILTSVFLLSLLMVAFFYSFILIILLILILVFSWIEFNVLIKRIINKNVYSSKIFGLILSTITLIYLLYFSVTVFNGVEQDQANRKLYIVYVLLVCICSDTGGFIFGKFFKGKKLSKISPNKTISGSIGSFILPMTLVPVFFSVFNEIFSVLDLLFLTIIISFICQLGDLFISYLKRKAKVKDTGDLLPGHGGILDRIDGIIFALPLGLSLLEFI